MALSSNCRSAVVAAAVWASLALAVDPAGPRPCQEHPQLIAKCFSVSGRARLYNGTPSVRIWPVGTNRLLGVSEGNFALPGYENLPTELKNMLNWESSVWGNFVVCPFTIDRPGTMRYVCVQSVSNVHVGPYTQPSNQPLHPTPSALARLVAGERRR